MHGGFHPGWSFWDWARFWCTPLGGISERLLHLRSLYLTFLFARDLRRLPARAVRPEAAVVFRAFCRFLRRSSFSGYPGGFRLTCYYYRGAYYKSFWADPPACAVSEPRKTYLGERSFPLILQNSHRYFLRLSYLVWGFLVYDAVKAFFFPNGFGIGIGSIVLVVNVVLLGGYVFGCHAFRHLVGRNIRPDLANTRCGTSSTIA